MRLSFPGPSRSFDNEKKIVSDFGDMTARSSFRSSWKRTPSIKLCPEMGGAEAGDLKAFDAERNGIHEVADQVYARGRKGTYAYVLTADKF